jgi:hypothetical protein
VHVRQKPAYLVAKALAEEDASVRHAAALALKLAAYLVIFGVTMPAFGLRSLAASVILAAVHTLLLWFADLVVLPRFGNLVATLGDVAVLVFGSVFVLGALAVLPNPVGLLAAVVAGTLFELWFHRWLLSSAIVE